MARSLSFYPSAASSLLLTLPAILGLVMLPSCMASNILHSGDTLYAGYCLESGNYTFCMQPDCHLVLYDGRNRVWDSGTFVVDEACHLTLENNGTLVVYDADGVDVVWHSEAAGAIGNYILMLQSNGKAVVYSPAIWSTRTKAVNIGGVNAIGEARDILLSGETLLAGLCLELGSYTFCMQQDCNLVLYHDGNPVWASGTDGKGIYCHVTMKDDGNLVIYDDRVNVVWQSNTVRGKGSYILVLQSDGQVVIYGPAIWQAPPDAVNIGSVSKSSTAGFAAVNNMAMVVAK